MMTIIACPVCSEKIEIPITIEARLIHSWGNGKKGFLTATVGAGGMEHTCSQ